MFNIKDFAMVKTNVNIQQTSNQGFKQCTFLIKKIKLIIETEIPKSNERSVKNSADPASIYPSLDFGGSL